jgi:outer membrane lipoprotein carrier protein
MREKPSLEIFIRLSLLCALLLRAGALAGGERIDEAEIVERLQRNYEATVDFVADFRQETEVRTLNRTLVARGQVYFKRPGKMLWRYDEPKGEWFLSDGKHLYYFQPEQFQVLKSALQRSFRSDLPLSFLLGLGNLKRDFRASVAGGPPGEYVIELKPRSGGLQLGELSLGVAEKSFDITSARVRDAAGNTTTVRFSAMRKGTGLKDDFFQPRIPAGADVVELGS